MVDPDGSLHGESRITPGRARGSFLLLDVPEQHPRMRAVSYRIDKSMSRRRKRDGALGAGTHFGVRCQVRSVSFANADGMLPAADKRCDDCAARRLGTRRTVAVRVS